MRLLSLICPVLSATFAVYPAGENPTRADAPRATANVADTIPAPAPAPPAQEVVVMPQATRSWRQSLGSAFRFWGKANN